MARWRALDEYTPIGRLLVDYMWEQRPPLLPSQFATRMGLPKQLVSSWLSGQATPSPAALLHLGRRMDQPVSQLLVAAGYTRETDPLLDIPGAWTYVLAALRQEQDPEQTLRFQELEALLLVVQEKDLEAWRAATAPAESGEGGAFWSRRRRRSEPLEEAEATLSLEDSAERAERERANEPEETKTLDGEETAHS